MPVEGGSLGRCWTLIAVTSAALAILAWPNALEAQKKARPSDRETPRVLAARLTGANQALSAGDPSASGVAVVRIFYTGRRLCWRVTLRDLVGPTAAHIHKGETEQAGPPVLTLSVPQKGNVAEGCAGVERAVLRDMLLNPESYHVNVHSARFPTGAIRGQLFSP